MSETVEDDENMIVLVIGDEKDLKSGQLIHIPDPITIKIEPVDNSADDDSGNEIVTSPAPIEERESAEEHEAESLEGNNIKDEFEEETEEFEIEYLEDVPDEYEFDDYDEDNNDSDYYKKSKKTTPKKKASNSKKKNYDSYVEYLRTNYPEMAENEQLLVDHLAGVMRSLKPSAPPENYCKEVIVEGKIKYECSLCEVQRDTEPLAARHYQFKHGEFYLTCYACGMKHRNTTNLYKHEKRCSAPDASTVLRARGAYLGRKGRGRPYTTNNRFITANTPLASKEKARLFCSKCPASFAHRENLVAHENSHEGMRPFRCNNCSMAYTSYPALKRHLKLHGEYQYICDHCGRKFKLKPALVSHLDSHRPIRKHGCMYCARRFTQKTALRHHTNKVHLNLPAAHGCPVCPKRYARLTHVKEHMGRVHGLTMITRRMYFQALPSMTDSEVTHARKFFNFDVNERNKSKDSQENEESKLIIPDVADCTIKHKGNLQKFVQIIQKKKQVQQLYYVQDNSKNKVDPTTDKNIVEVDTAPDGRNTPKPEEKPKPKKRKKWYPRRIKSPETKVDEEIDDDICNMEYKRQKRTMAPAQEEKIQDNEMHEIVRNIKSTLSNRRVLNTRADKKTLNFYKLRQDFIQGLKNEIDIPPEVGETNEEEPENLAPEEMPSENLVPGTEIPESLAPKKKGVSNDSDVDEEWKVYKDASEKNVVIADFLNYMKSGVVPKRARILRKGREE